VITVSLHALRIFGHHGVHPEERTHGQDFLFDVELEVGDRGLSDRIEDAVDYTAVARTVREVSAAREYHLLEALADAIVEEMLRRFGAEKATVRVTKPAVQPAGLEGTVSVMVTRSSPSGRSRRS